MGILLERLAKRVKRVAEDVRAREAETRSTHVGTKRREDDIFSKKKKGSVQGGVESQASFPVIMTGLCG